MALRAPRGTWIYYIPVTVVFAGWPIGWGARYLYVTGECVGRSCVVVLCVRAFGGGHLTVRDMLAVAVVTVADNKRKIAFWYLERKRTRLCGGVRAGI